MDLLTLQQRANVLVDKVNEYEANLAKYEITENDYLNQHKYCDIFCLRAVMQLLFGSTASEKLDRTLNQNSSLRLFASTAPAWNTSFKFNPISGLLYLLNSNIQVINDPPNKNGVYSFSYSDPTGYLVYNFAFTNVETVETVLVCNLSGSNTTNSIWVSNSASQFLVVNPVNHQVQVWTPSGDRRFGHSNIKPETDLQFKIITAPNPTREGYITSKFYFLNNTEYSLLGEVSYSGSISNGTKNFIGSNAYDGTEHFSTDGTIDLTKSYIKINDNNPIYFVEVQASDGDYDINQTKHRFANDINLLNSYNLIAHDSYLNEIDSKNTRTNSGLNYSYSSNIADALVTESQVANMFKWNTTTSLNVPNNTISSNRQVPGIVCYYLGPDYDNQYTSTIPYNPNKTTLNGVNYNNPSTYGAGFRKGERQLPMPICALNGVQYSQYSANCANEQSDKGGLKLFMTGLNYTRGKLESPQQIWQPDEKYGDDNLNYGYNRQGSAVYHELVFKNRRSGCKDAGVDFTPGLASVADNDPQGLAIRTALAQQKKFFTNRPWFTELNPLVDQDMTKFADNMISNQIESEATEESPIVYKTDTDYINNYKLDYETYANSFNQPL